MTRHLVLFTVCFNAEKTIRATIESILANEKPNEHFTYIVQDGASTDNTVAIAKEYEKDGVIIRSEKDRGAYDAIDKAVLSVTNPTALIGFIHADDIITPGTLPRIRELLSRNPEADIVSIGCAIQNEAGTILHTFNGNNLKLSVQNCLEGKPLPNARFVTKRLYNELGLNRWSHNGRPYVISADMDFFIRATTTRPQLVQDNAIGYIYLSHQASTTFGNSDKVLRQLHDEHVMWLTEYLAPQNRSKFTLAEQLILRRQTLIAGRLLAKDTKSLTPLWQAIHRSGLIWLPISLALVASYVFKKVVVRIKPKLHF